MTDTIEVPRQGFLQHAIFCAFENQIDELLDEEKYDMEKARDTVKPSNVIGRDIHDDHTIILYGEGVTDEFVEYIRPTRTNPGEWRTREVPVMWTVEYSFEDHGYASVRIELA